MIRPNIEPDAMTNTMKKRDPFSTPARRRRIIADVAHKVLRKYCITACNNVHRFRIETKASLSIQCAWRCYAAKKQLFHLWWNRRHKAAIRIQSIWRMKLAWLLKVRLRNAWVLSNKKKIAKFVYDHMRYKKAKLARKRLIAKRKATAENRINEAAIMIQRHVRRYLSGERYKYMLYEYYQMLKLKNFAACFIQRQWIRYKIGKKYLLMRRRCLAMRLLYWKMKTWWKRRKSERIQACIIMQKCIRRYLTQIHYHRLLALNQKPSTPPSPVSSPSLPLIIPVQEPMVTKDTIAIQVELAASVLTIFANQGSQLVFQWCLAQSILNYHNKQGYTIGAVIRQVLQAVDVDTAAPFIANMNTKASFSQRNQQDQEERSGQEEKELVIVIHEWAKNESQKHSIITDNIIAVNNNSNDTSDEPDTEATSIVPDPSIIPQEWNTEGKHPLYGDIIYFNCHQTIKTIDIHIVHEVSRTTDEIKVIDYCISLIADAISSNTVNSACEMKQQSESGNDAAIMAAMLLLPNKLYFKNAILVLPPNSAMMNRGRSRSRPVTTNQIPGMMMDEHEFDAQEKGEKEDDNEEDEEEKEEEEVRRIRIQLLEEEEKEDIIISPPIPPVVIDEEQQEPSLPALPSPPQPPVHRVDYHAMAKRIQRTATDYRMWKRRQAIHKIQTTYLRSKLLLKWQYLVYDVLTIAHHSATVIQSRIRQFLACRKVENLWMIYCAEYGQIGSNGPEEYAKIEESRKWQAFGEISSWLSPDDTKDVNQSMVLVDLTLPKGTNKTHCYADRVTNPIGEMLSIVQYPSPPPNCLRWEPDHILLRVDKLLVVKQPSATDSINVYKQHIEKLDQKVNVTQKVEEEDDDEDSSDEEDDEEEEEEEEESEDDDNNEDDEEEEEIDDENEDDDDDNKEDDSSTEGSKMSETKKNTKTPKNVISADDTMTSPLPFNTIQHHDNLFLREELLTKYSIQQSGTLFSHTHSLISSTASSLAALPLEAMKTSHQCYYTILTEDDLEVTQRDKLIASLKEQATNNLYPSIDSKMWYYEQMSPIYHKIMKKGL